MTDDSRMSLHGLPLCSPAAASRRTDPATSHATAAMAGGVRADHIKRILAALRLGPASKDEIGLRANLIGHAVGKRLPELQRAGLIETTGANRRSASGRPEREWRLRG